MTLRIDPLTAPHCLALAAADPRHQGEITAEVAVSLEGDGGWAAVDGNTVVAIAGIHVRWAGVGLAWAWLGRGWQRHARLITDLVRDGLDKADLHRIETGVRADFVRGHRWVRRLGFEMETPLARGWGPDGSDYTLYVRVA